MGQKNIYSKKTVAQLRAIAVTHFHKYIRNRDAGQPCISCDSFTTLQAGHFYSAGNNPSVRFNEDNVHGQCKYSGLGILVFRREPYGGPASF